MGGAIFILLIFNQYRKLNMSTRNERLQNIYHLYKEKTGNVSVDSEQLAEWAMTRGMAAPQPKTAKELLAAQFSDALRAEYSTDEETGLEYRKNHNIRYPKSDGRQGTLWFDIDDASFAQMSASLTNRRQQMVGDAVHLKTDEFIWNKKNPSEQQIELRMDFSEDVQEHFALKDVIV
jgi:hypothetical protein